MIAKRKHPAGEAGWRTFEFVEHTQLELLEVLDGGWIEEPTNENVLFAFEPRVVMAAMHTTTMRASITAYSTAVGPSSLLTKLTRVFVIARISDLLNPATPGLDKG